MITVRIRECGGRNRTWTRRARTANQHEAIARVINRLWGKGAWLHIDAGLANIGRYGQIVKWDAAINANNCLTGRVSVEVE